MAETNEGEQLDLETGNTMEGSSSMNTEITKERASTPTEPPPTSVKKENTTTPTENSKSERGTGKEILLFLLGLILLPFVPVFCLIRFAFLIAARKKWTIWVVLEWIALLGFTGFLIASLTKHNLKNHLIWELELWKWCILFMVVVCGELISQWIVNAVFLLISLFFANNLKVYCFVYGLKEKNRVFVWWCLVLIAWLVLVIWFGNRGGTRSEETKMILDYVTRALASLSIGAGLWLVKNLLLWSFAISFQSKFFFERILKAKFHKFVTETLHSPSRPSVLESLTTRYDFFNWADELKRMEEGKKSVFSIQLFIDCISGDSNYQLKPQLEDGKKDQEEENGHAEPSASATTIWKMVHERKRELDDEKRADQSLNLGNGENRFKNAGQAILHGVANLKRSAEDTAAYVIPATTKTGISLPFTDAEVEMLFKGSDCRADIKEWLEIVYGECSSLKSSLDNTRRGMEELNKLAKGIILVLILIVWLLMMRVLSTQAVALILSQFFVLTFVFGDACKRIFDGIIFAYVTHPFDVGDRCLIQDREAELFVKEINIQTTVFSSGNVNKEEIVYPNSLLATKHICNFRKIPKLDMTDSVEFVVEASTSTEQIDTLNVRLEEHIKEKVPSIKDISVHANGFEDGDKIKMGVYVTYKDFWKDNEQKSAFKSKIVLGLKQILEGMGISKDMTDSVEFVVDASTSTEQIDTLNFRLKEHIKEKVPSIKDISFHAKRFEDEDKIKMDVYVTYKDCWKDNEEKSAWKSKIVLGLKRILEDMGISKYSKKNNVESGAAAIPPAVV